MILSANDILNEFNISNTSKKQEKLGINFSDDIEKSIYNLLLLEPLSIDELKAKLGLDISLVLLKISILEL
jgi:predicted Rossmann fold nucleotide-binding protein DprA/Smf involved in DNA uptake